MDNSADNAGQARRRRDDGLRPRRLASARESQGLTQEQVAGMTGVAANTVYCWETGRQRPGFATVLGLSVLYRHPVDWFYPEGLPVSFPEGFSLAGSFLESSRVSFLLELISRGASAMGVPLSDVLGQGLRDPVESSSGSAGFRDSFPVSSLPLSAAAGAGAEVLDESRTDHVSLDSRWLYSHVTSPDLCDMISVSGDSMDPTLPDGCSILVDRGQTELRDGRIFVLRTDDGLVVKRVRRDGELWQLVSDNPSWDPVPLGPEDAVIGEVRWSGRLV
jgi:SOS-response transcriptional repressor LexA/DNA-binding transcriptional regulator YiaG